MYIPDAVKQYHHSKASRTFRYKNLWNVKQKNVRALVLVPSHLKVFFKNFAYQVLEFCDCYHGLYIKCYLIFYFWDCSAALPVYYIIVYLLGIKLGKFGMPKMRLVA